VSSETPATHLARLKVTFPYYLITRAPLRPGYTATDRDSGRCIDAPTLAELEAALIEAGGKGCPDGT
jgi:hypothetical protein